MTRLAIDPVTRVRGQLRIEVDIADGAVRDAWCSGTTYRGVERILEGRDARDAWLIAQRICGSCGSAHALASVRACEQALGLAIPTNARLIRNLLLGSLYVASHIVHFYQRQAFDWVDATTALRGDPAAASTFARSVSDWPGSSAAHFAEAKSALVRLGASGTGGPLNRGDWGHPAYTLPAEASLVILAHYLEALDWHRTLLRIQALLGGKGPHPQSFLVGGMTLAPEWTGPRRPLGEHPWGTERTSPAPLSADGLAEIEALLDHATSFVDGVFLPDVRVIAEHYRDWAAIGTGVGNFLAFGEFPEADSANPPLALPAGRVMSSDPSARLAVDQTGVAESVAHAWYDAGDALRQPWDETTDPRYAGPTPPITTLEGVDRYSWLKAPRYFDDPMEVGPLARTVVACAAGTADVQARVDAMTARPGPDGRILSGTLGRTVARAVEAGVVAARLPGWLTDLKANLAGNLAVVDISKWEPGSWPAESRGWAFAESPGGAAGHWLVLARNRIDRYQVVDANTWNVSPRDNRGRRGALEEALVGTPVSDPDRPVEILRTVHSFDPCLACGAH
jgi:Ni,Fe-hydrogenase I large subunit